MQNTKFMKLKRARSLAEQNVPFSDFPTREPYITWEDLMEAVLLAQLAKEEQNETRKTA